MPTYVVLGNYTDQGMKNVAGAPERAWTFQSQSAQAGIQVRGMYWTLGQYDFAVILDAPDDEAITGALLKLMGQGNVRTQTLRAFDTEGLSRILEKAR